MIRLSEAIRLGAMLKPQGFGNSSYSLLSANSCAMGAAAQAVWQSLFDPFRWIYGDDIHSCPDCGGGCHLHPRCAAGIIWRLNDIHKWSRERIADWVATIEPRFDPQSTPETATQLAEVLSCV